MGEGFLKWMIQFLVDHPTFAPFILSVLANAILIYAVKTLYLANVLIQKETLDAVGKATTTISTLNTLINLLVAGKSRR